MKLLAIETSTSTCSLALFDNARKGGEQYFLLEKHMFREQASLLLPMIASMLSDFAISLDALDAILYGCGPGSYTGIRLAASAAQALAYGLDLPVIPVSSTAALAHTIFVQEAWQRIAVCIDARMGQIYWANYSANATGELKSMTSDLICAPEDLVQFEDSLSLLPYCGVGDGWAKYNQEIVNGLGFKPSKVLANLKPKATAVIALGKAKFEQNLFVEPKNALPIYLQ